MSTADAVAAEAGASRRFETATKVAGGFSILVGVLVLVGWSFRIGGLKSVFPGLVEMKANTALALVLAGTSLWLLRSEHASGRRRRAGRALASIVALLGALTLSEYLLGWDLGIDQLLFRELPGAISTSSPGRMALATAVSFLLIGTALAALDIRTRRRFWPSQVLLLLAIPPSAVALLGYLYGARPLYGGVPSFTAIAVHTGAALVVLSVGGLLARPDWGLVALTRGERPGAVMVRRFGAALILVSPILGWLRLRGELAGLYPAEVGVAIYALASILLSATLILLGARWLNRIDVRRRRAEKALRTRAEEIEDLYNHAPCGYHSVNADGLIAQINDTELEWLGYTREEVVGRTHIRDLLSGEGRERFPEMFSEFKRSGRIRDQEFEMVRKDGTTFSVLLSAAAIYDAQGAFVSSRSTMIDITARKQAQDAARQNERFLDSVVENIPDMIFVKDAQALRFVRFNRAGEELLGYARDDLIGKNDHDLFPPEDADHFTAKDREVLEGGTVVDIPAEPIETRVHGRRTLHTKKIPVLDREGKPRYLLGISEDITDRTRAEEELHLAKEEAERANRAKSDYLSRMSHELRTPLNAILGFGQLLEMDGGEGDQHESVVQILKAGHHLLDLINEVLDIARIESGRMALSVEPVHVDDAVTEALALIRPLAPERNVEIVYEQSALEADYVLADRQRLKQILLNLLSNALKYNRDGGSVSLSCRTEPGARYLIEVSDSGPGLEPEKLARLFMPFERLGAEEGGVQGTGLGLALSKGLVETMGGTIRVASELGRGSAFTIELPVAEGQHQQLDGTEALIGGSRPEVTGTVLYVEDNLSNLKLVERVLERRPGVRLLSAMQGRLGLELAKEHRPDAILLDLHLPDISGDETLRRLRADPQTRDIPVIVVSADATANHISELLSQGALAYVTKPLDLLRLLEMLDEVLDSRFAGRAG